MAGNLSSVWENIPDDITLHVFTFLPAASLLKAAQVCRGWYRVTRDELLWRDLFYRHWGIDRHINMAPGKMSWLQEYKRLHYHSPAVESEVIRQHTDQVLHVSFSNNGKMFASCSKDGYIKVWNTTYPVSLKYKENMKRYTWKYTQFSQFNESDTLLLVSGVHFGPNTTSGEIAVFSLTDNFELQARVINKPYDVFGTWYNDTHLISGTLHWTGQLQSCSVLWLNKAYQDTESEHESVVMRLYKLRNINASSVRTVMVASCREVMETNDEIKGSKRMQTSKEMHKGESCCKYAKINNDELLGAIEYNQVYRDAENCRGTSIYPEDDLDGCLANGCHSLKSCSPNEVNMFGRCSKHHYDNENVNQNRHHSDIPDVDNLVEKTTKCVTLTSEVEMTPVESSLDKNGVNVPGHNGIEETGQHSSQYACAQKCSCRGGMYLGGSLFGSPIQSNYFSSHDHKLALDDRNPMSCLHMGDNSITLPNSLYTKFSAEGEHSSKIIDKFLIFTQGSQTYTPHQIGIKRIKPIDKITNDEGDYVLPDVEYNTHGLERVEYDTIDKVIDMHGHIIGLALSPDQRYLYVNCRPWPKDYDIQNPLAPPPIAQQIDIHVIDLLRMTEVGTMYRAHKAYTPNDECFFIFLDVSQQYVASGAEDKHGYIWDRHYGVCLNKFRHDDVVNCVAFSPRDPELLITVSDDCTIKVWRSLNRDKNKKFTGLFNPGLYS